jgi:predicted GIY-YIG superfamily endonuclease
VKRPPVLLIDGLELARLDPAALAQLEQIPLVYMVRHSPTGRSYIGSTLMCTRRIRQHNALIQGGAKATRTVLDLFQGEWRFSILCKADSWHQALRTEWHWKRARRLPAKSARRSVYFRSPDQVAARLNHWTMHGHATHLDATGRMALIGLARALVHVQHDLLHTNE